MGGSSKERVGHPTQKPKVLIRRVIRSLSFEGSIVLDFFAGSGVSSCVAIEENRHSISGDADPDFLEYFDSHLQQSTGQMTMSYVLHKPYHFVEDISQHPVSQVV